jgi:hypothetical protein
MRNATSDDSQTLTNFSELLRLRRGAERRSKFLWKTMLFSISLLLGVWVKTDWAFISDHGLALFDKVGVFFHSTF